MMARISQTANGARGVLGVRLGNDLPNYSIGAGAGKDPLGAYRRGGTFSIRLYDTTKQGVYVIRKNDLPDYSVAPVPETMAPMLERSHLTTRTVSSGRNLCVHNTTKPKPMRWNTT